MKTALTRLVGVEHPVVQTGMGWVAGPRLVAASAEAGGLGILASATMTYEELQKAIAETKSRTDKPFGVNLTILPSITPPPYAEYRQAIIESGITIVETAGSNPADQVAAFQPSGVKVLHKCTSVRHALPRSSRQAFRR